MRIPGLKRLTALIRARTTVVSAAPLPGRFQSYSHTLPDRYPWLFRFAADRLAGKGGVRLLSFGCSRGDEVFSLRSYFPAASIKGIDIDPQNIASCERRARRERAANVSFEVAATTQAEADESYDAIFCLAVLCLGDLTTEGAQQSDPRLTFVDFERTVTDFSRCLKPFGLLVLHTTNFRFCDLAVAGQYQTLLEAEPAQMAPDVQFDRNNRLLPEPRYRAVVFRKRAAAV